MRPSGFPVEAGQASSRMSYTGSMRSTLTGSFVNEARVGYSGAPVSSSSRRWPSHVHR
jgi:hypothetical protein